MPPTAVSEHTDKLMTDFALGYQNQEFVADQIFPVVPVDYETDKYDVFGLEDRDVVEDLHPDNGGYTRVTHGKSQDSYACLDRGLEDAIPFRKINNADPTVKGNLVERATANLMQRILLNREKRVLEKVGTGSNWTTTAALSGIARWDNAESDPVTTILTYKTAMRALGVEPDTLFLAGDVWDKLQVHPTFMEVFKNTGIISSVAQIAARFEISRIILSRAVYNTTKPGQNRSLSLLFSKKAFLFRSPPPGDVGMATPKCGAIFCWTGDTEGQRYLVERYDDKAIRGHVVRVRSNTDEKITAADFGCLLTTVIS